MYIRITLKDGYENLDKDIKDEIFKKIFESKNNDELWF